MITKIGSGNTKVSTRTAGKLRANGGIVAKVWFQSEEI